MPFWNVALDLATLWGANTAAVPAVHLWVYLKSMRSAVQFPPICGASSFIYSGTHIRAHITTQAHLWCKRFELGSLVFSSSARAMVSFTAWRVIATLCWVVTQVTSASSNWFRRFVFRFAAS
ncbi:hypothetical protein E2C01_038679 [Portunus trituberculatus]|uniref:Uncharacterized protein n=1 Tax=Portunus trituberculatus TaxID=210409 RepID=A0A5B7FHT4_PORTR|nr:hypothetical protein [Portunus trituberculatus]